MTHDDLLRVRVVRRRRALTGGADRADVAEQLVKQAAVTAEGRSLVAARMDRGDLLHADMIDRGDVAILVEMDVQDRLVGQVRLAVAHVPRVAGYIIPVVLVEGSGEARPAERVH